MHYILFVSCRQHAQGCVCVHAFFFFITALYSIEYTPINFPFATQWSHGQWPVSGNGE